MTPTDFSVVVTICASLFFLCTAADKTGNGIQYRSDLQVPAARVLNGIQIGCVETSPYWGDGTSIYNDIIGRMDAIVLRAEHYIEWKQNDFVGSAPDYEKAYSRSDTDDSTAMNVSLSDENILIEDTFYFVLKVYNTTSRVCFRNYVDDVNVVIFQEIPKCTVKKRKANINVDSDGTGYINTNSINTSTTRIVGGSAINSPAWVAQFWNDTGSMNETPICGGSLISERYILTAGHCGIRPASTYLTLGTTKLASPRVRYSIKKIFRHPSYSHTGNTVDNDLAVVELTEPVTRDTAVPVRMNRDSTVPAVSQELSVVGFGRIAFKWKKFVPYLIHVNVPVISMDICRKSYKEELNATSQFCAGTTHCDSCSGDSGNPVYGDINGHSDNVIYGVTSFGKDCGVGMPAVYARVDHAAVWIDSMIIDEDRKMKRSQITLAIMASTMFAICIVLAVYQNQKHQEREEQDCTGTEETAEEGREAEENAVSI